ncbi:MAG TPA: histidinol dehydrogenase, partial [Nitrospiria bacterium]
MKLLRVPKGMGNNNKWLKGIREKSGAGSAVETPVRKILDDVRRQGDRAVLKYTKKFDRASYTTRQIRIRPSQVKAAYRRVSATAVKALRFAARRIREFHEHQKCQGFQYKKDRILLGQMVRPLDRVGIYVPGGKAAYPSSVLMNGIPAKVAGVPEVVMCMPTPGGEINPNLLVAADLARVNEIYTVGGAQAIGALAFGTKSIKRVDKIVGPGNIYVATAKKQVFGAVDIDMIAGPSEIVVIADTSADPRFVAADLLSQAEHDEDAISILVTTSEALVKKVQEEMKRQLPLLSRKQIIRSSLSRNGRMFLVKNLRD